MDARRQAVQARRTARISTSSRRTAAARPRPDGRGSASDHEGTFPAGHQQEGRAGHGVHPPLGRGAHQLRPELRAGPGLQRTGRHRRRQPLRGQGVPRRLLQGPDRLVPREPGPRSRPGSRSPGPADFTLNSVGTKVEETVEDGRRTAVWESDHPVSFFNVVAGRWDVKRGEGTAVYYHPGHPYNIDEMLEALDAARKYYSEWFHPYPVEGAEAQRVPRPGDLRPGVPDQHHLLRGDRLPDQGAAPRSTPPS